MYNPFPYDDPRPVNRPVLGETTVKALIRGGTVKSAAALAGVLAARGKSVIAFDGYTTADFGAIVNLLTQQLHVRGLKVALRDFSVCYKSEAELYDMLEDYCDELRRQILNASENARTMMGFYLNFLQQRFASSMDAIIGISVRCFVGFTSPGGATLRV